MTRQEHLLVRAMEECAELTHRLSKALVFSMNEVQPGQTLTNHERIIGEFTDVVAVMEMAGFSLAVIDDHIMDEKQDKVEKFLEYSRACGTLLEVNRETATSMKSCAD